MKINNKNIKTILTQSMSRFGKELMIKKYNINQDDKKSLDNLSFYDIYKKYEMFEWRNIFASICTNYIANVICKVISDYCIKHKLNENNIYNEMLGAIQKTSEEFTYDERCFIACKIKYHPSMFNSVKDVLKYIMSNGLVNMYDICDIINSLFWWEASTNIPREEWERLSHYTQPKLTEYFVNQPIQKTVDQIHKKYKI